MHTEQHVDLLMQTGYRDLIRNYAYMYLLQFATDMEFYGVIFLYDLLCLQFSDGLHSIVSNRYGMAPSLEDMLMVCLSC